jgi:hypothetical protein
MLGKIGGAPSTAHIVARVVHGQPSADGEGYTIGVRFEEFVDVKAEDLLAHITRGE